MNVDYFLCSESFSGSPFCLWDKVPKPFVVCTVSLQLHLQLTHFIEITLASFPFLEIYSLPPALGLLPVLCPLPGALVQPHHVATSYLSFRSQLKCPGSPRPRVPLYTLCAPAHFLTNVFHGCYQMIIYVIICLL